MSIDVLEKLKIRTRLFTGFGIIMILIAIIGVYTITSSNSIKHEIEDLNDSSMKAALASMTMKTAVYQTQQWFTDISATRGLDGFDDGFDEAEKWAGTFRSKVAVLRTIFKDNAEMVRRLDDLEASYGEYYGVGRKMAEAYIAGGPSAGNKVMSEFDGYADRINGRVSTITADTLSALDTNVAMLHDHADHSKSLSTILLIVSLVLSVILSILIAGSITTPLKRTISMLKDIAEGHGDLTKRVESSSKDEVGELAHYFNLFVKKIETIIVEIKENAGSLTAQSRSIFNALSQMEVVSTSISSQADSAALASGDVSINVSTIAGATDVASSTVTNVSTAAAEMSQNMAQVADTTKDVLANANAVAAAIEEMSSTVSEITKNTNHAANISHEASQKAGDAEHLMKNLSGSADTVGKVVEVINDIADRTNLLALNATIEAASAGEAGKGFAVVANEVKELAKQTTEATKEVVKQIEEMQGNTERAVHAIDEIVLTITEINNINTSIAATVEEQDATTNEVAQTTIHTVEAMESVASNVEDAAQGAEEVARNAAELSAGVSAISTNVTEAAQRASGVSENIQSLNGATDTTLTVVQDVHKSVVELSAVTENLNHLVSQFIIDEDGNGGGKQSTDGKVKPFITWQSSYSVGVDQFDAQHKRLINLINELNEAMALGSGKERVASILDGLVDYTSKHFSSEEAMMKKCGYGGYGEQCSEHGKLLDQVAAFKSDFDQGKAVVNLKLMGFLKDWLVKHILQSDMKYKDFFADKKYAKVV